MSAPFSLLSWNVLADCFVTPGWYPGVPDEDLRGPQRRARVLDALARMEADVMALQEVAVDLLPDLRARFPDHGLAWLPGRNQGLAVLVRGPTPWSQVLRQPENRREALLVRLSGGATLVNVHLPWTGDPTPCDDREGLRLLRTVLDHQPDLVAGDFNAFPEWPERLEAATRGWVELGPPGPTCNVHRRLQPLDAVLGRPGWRAEALPLPPIAADTLHALGCAPQRPPPAAAAAVGAAGLMHRPLSAPDEAASSSQNPGGSMALAHPTYLRAVVTARCTLACAYCHQEGDPASGAAGD